MPPSHALQQFCWCHWLLWSWFRFNWVKFAVDTVVELMQVAADIVLDNFTTVSVVVLFWLIDGSTCNI